MSDLQDFLRAHGIAAPAVDHPPVMTVEEADRLVPPLPGAKTKNLFLRDKKGTRHLLCTVPSHLPVDLKQLGAMLVGGSVGFASEERLRRHLGIAPGCVSLLALFNDRDHAVEFVIDRTLWEADAVQAHPLVNTSTLSLSHDDLDKFLAATGHPARVIDVPAREIQAVESGSGSSRAVRRGSGSG